MKYLGKKFLYETIGVNGVKMNRGTITSVEFHKELGPIFNAISPFGNTFRVTKREIHKIIN
jgi:hypothetical protein